MLNFHIDTKNERKCIVTHGIMGHLDPTRPSTKRKPFAPILNHRFVQKVEFLLPEEIYQIIKNDVFADRMSPVYSRVILPLKELVEGDFFTEYIKKGNVLMLSEGRTGVDNVFSLKEGILKLHLDRENYERAGLVGKPDGVQGKRGTRPRWVVEINLRLPSMLHGKKVFDRIVYAFKNVLTTPVTWLFCDLGTTDPMEKHFPCKITCSPSFSHAINVNIPPLQPPTEINPIYGDEFEDFAIEINEWLSLVSLESPRIDPDDKIDSFLSRYVSPGAPTTESKLIRVTWRGFISPSWAHKTLIQVLLAVPGEQWFAYSVEGFGESWSNDSKNCTFLKVPKATHEYVLWEIV
ncbi:hypothetical protein B7494_g3154 [Chlorociboria aeruginascens]|nr:hypothetical protein B7494_g3154 [Chlorociboria aeruginascens]